MIASMYKKAFAVLMKKPVQLWGITLLCLFLILLAYVGFGPVVAVSFAIQLALEAAMAMIYLTTYRTGQQPRATDLFSVFRKGRFLRVVGGLAWMYLWIFLWALIPVVGFVFAMIRAYEYCFTPYILMTRDNVKPTQAIQLSKQMTMGYKGKLFWSQMFVVLGFLIVYLILLLFATIPYIGVLFGIIAVLFTLAFVLLAPLFLGLVQAAFYDHIQSAPATIPAQTAPAAPAASAETPAAPTADAPTPDESPS